MLIRGIPYVVSHFVTESLTKFDPATVSISDGDTSGSSTSEPTSILRRRKPTEGMCFIGLNLIKRILYSILMLQLSAVISQTPAG